MIEILALPAFADNYIWLLRRDGRAAVVDPGDAAPVLAHLAASGDRLCAILLTHHHGDHVGGVAELLGVSQVPVYAPAVENIPGTTHPLQGGETIAVAELALALEVLAVPGHTRGHIAYYGAKLAPHGAVFCGDTLFGGGCGRLFEGTPAQLQASLAALAALPDDTAVYCAHEYTQSNLRFAAAVEPNNPEIARRVDTVAAERAAGRSTVPTRIDVEQATNPFLRWDVPEVRATAARLLSREPRDAVETFAALREWKNRF